jgi:hypothetical protein
MGDPLSATVRTAARAAADRLAGEYGPGLVPDVEAALRPTGTGQRPAQYLDPVSVGSLIVAIATLAWTIYSSRRDKTPESDDLSREVRVKLRKQNIIIEQKTDRITEIVVTEIIRAAKEDM